MTFQLLAFLSYLGDQSVTSSLVKFTVILRSPPVAKQLGKACSKENAFQIQDLNLY